MDWSELSQQDWVQIVAYGTIVTYLALIVPSLFRGRVSAGMAALAFWCAALFVALAGYSYRYEIGTVAERIMAVLSPGTVITSGLREVTVFRRPDGEFTVDAAIGKARVSFTLDTGATSVVLRAEEAMRLKIPIKKLAYDVEVATANGRSLAAEVVLPQLSVGPLVQTDVKALVARPGALHENLLGMSYLGRLESFTVSNDKLVLRGR